MTRNEVLQKLRKPYDNVYVGNLWVFLFNNYKKFKISFKNFFSFANLHLKSKDYDSVLFVQYVYNGLVLLTKKRDFEIAYYSRFNELFRFDEGSVYKLSSDIVRYIEDMYFRR